MMIASDEEVRCGLGGGIGAVGSDRAAFDEGAGGSQAAVDLIRRDLKEPQDAVFAGRFQQVQSSYDVGPRKIRGVRMVLVPWRFGGKVNYGVEAPFQTVANRIG